MTLLESAFLVLGTVFLFGIVWLAVTPLLMLVEQYRENDPHRRELSVLAYARAEPRPKTIVMGCRIRQFLFRVWLVALGITVPALLFVLLTGQLK